MPMKLRRNATNRPSATVFAPCCAKKRVRLGEPLLVEADPASVSLHAARRRRAAPIQYPACPPAIVPTMPAMTTPTIDSVPRPASAAAVTSAVSPGIGQPGRLDEQERGDERVAVLRDPLIDDVEHSCWRELRVGRSEAGRRVETTKARRAIRSATSGSTSFRAGTKSAA